MVGKGPKTFVCITLHFLSRKEGMKAACTSNFTSFGPDDDDDENEEMEPICVYVL